MCGATLFYARITLFVVVIVRHNSISKSVIAVFSSIISFKLSVIKWADGPPIFGAGCGISFVPSSLTNRKSIALMKVMAEKRYRRR